MAAPADKQARFFPGLTEAPIGTLIKWDILHVTGGETEGWLVKPAFPKDTRLTICLISGTCDSRHNDRDTVDGKKVTRDAVKVPPLHIVIRNLD
jgi:hypothetical protein